MSRNAMMRAALTAHRATDLGQQLSKAVYVNNIDEVRRLLSIPGININYQEHDGRTPLMNTVYVQNKPEIMRLLLAYPRINVNLRDNYGKTALIMATTSHTEANSHEPARSKNLECIRQLVAFPRIDLNHIDVHGNSALSNTIRFRKPEAFKLLLDAGADVNVINKDIASSRTPLMEASIGNSIEILRALLAAPGIQVNAVNQKNQTALFMAVNYGQRLNVQELLKAPGIDVNISTQDGITPIMRASEQNADGIIRDLLNAGAVVPQPVPEPIQIQQHLMATERQRVEHGLFQTLLGRHAGNIGFIKAQTHLAPLKANTNRAAQTASQRLLFAVQTLDVDEVRRLLKVPGINVNVLSIAGDTPLYEILRAHGTMFGPKKALAKAILDMLLAAPGLNPNTPVHYGPPLCIALKNHDKYALGALLNHPAIDLDTKDRYGQTTLMYASHDSPRELIDMILDKRLDINAVDNQGHTALILAAQANKPGLVGAFLKVPGIDVNIRDRHGDSAMSSVAHVWGRLGRPIIRMLLEKGAEVKPDDHPVVQEENQAYLREMLNTMSTSRRNPLNPNVMGQIKTFIGGMMRTRRIKKTRKTRRRR